MSVVGRTAEITALEETVGRLLAGAAPVGLPERGLLEVPELTACPGEPDRAGAAAWLCASKGEDLELTRSLARAALAGPSAMLMGRVGACGALVLTDDLDEALAGLDLVLADARRLGLTAVTSRALVLRAKVMMSLGRIEDAAHDVERAGAVLPIEDWHPDVRPLFAAMDAVLSLQRGLPDRAEAVVAAVSRRELGFGHSTTVFLFVLAVLASMRGDAHTALAHLEECGRRSRARQTLNPALLPWRSAAAEALRALGDRERADALSAEELAHAQQWGAPSALAVAHLSRAAFTSRHEHLHEAVRVLRDSPCLLLRAGALLDLAQVVEPSTAQPLVREAAQIAVTCRSTPLITRARDLGWVPGS